MRLIHTSDWHVGKVFDFAGDRVMALLQQARLNAIAEIGKLAMAENARTVLVAGDVYDRESPDAKTLAEPLEVMRRFPTVAWHLIPGNHDPDLPGGLWRRLSSLGLPDNVHLQREASPVRLDERSWLLPAPLRQRHGNDDPTAWMDLAPTPEGQRRIGLAHGSIAEFGSTSPRPDRIAPDRAQKAGLAYLALGDWHGTKSINAQTWYAGTPEPDGFDQTESGHALLVDLDGGRPIVTRHPTARYAWQEETAALHDAGDIRRLEQRFRTAHADLSRLLLRLRVSGMLTLAEHDLFGQTIAETGLAAALCLLDLDRQGLIVRPSEEELDRLSGDLVVKEAIRRLRAIAESAEHPDRPAASRAIQHLQLACHRRRREAAA
ncbi:MAG: DNA repair exonuclease [Alphaproteobacteria bacterium]|nr:DNA repair exonuclease [Alphaproteobacteria bacterium]